MIGSAIISARDEVVLDLLADLAEHLGEAAHLDRDHVVVARVLRRQLLRRRRAPRARRRSMKASTSACVAARRPAAAGRSERPVRGRLLDLGFGRRAPRSAPRRGRDGAGSSTVAVLRPHEQQELGLAGAERARRWRRRRRLDSESGSSKPPLMSSRRRRRRGRSATTKNTAVPTSTALRRRTMKVPSRVSTPSLRVEVNGVHSTPFGRRTPDDLGHTATPAGGAASVVGEVEHQRRVVGRQLALAGVAVDQRPSAGARRPARVT